MAYQIIKNQDFAEVIKQLNQRLPIVIPTDTVWGILCSEKEPIYNLKKRAHTKKIIQFVKSDYLDALVNGSQLKLLKTFWPGSLTVVFKKKAYRCPNNELLLEIIKAVNYPLYCSSANISGQKVINSPSQAIEVFMCSKQNFCVYEGNSNINALPSTILDIDNWTILRAGENETEIMNFLKQNHVIS